MAGRGEGWGEWGNGREGAEERREVKARRKGGTKSWGI